MELYDTSRYCIDGGKTGASESVDDMLVMLLPLR